MSLLHFIVLIELITAFVGSFYFKKYKASPLRHFIILLWVVAIWESIGFLSKFYDLHFTNTFGYNLISTVQLAYLFGFYYSILRSKGYKFTVAIFLICFLLVAVINSIFFQPLGITNPFNSNIFALGAILLVITIGIYLIEILNSERILLFRTYLPFWISIGLFVFYAGVTPLMIYLKFLKDLSQTDLTTVILFILSVTMYSCFIIGFIVSDKYTD